MPTHHQGNKQAQQALTETGQELIARIMPRHIDNIATRLAVLSPQEQDGSRRLCRKLGLTC